MNKLSRLISLLILASGMLILLFSQVSAQSNISLIIDAITSDDFPQIEADVSVIGTNGLPMKDLTQDNFSVSEDNQSVSDFVVTPIKEHPMEFVLVIDTSASMGYGSGPTPMENIIQTVSEFVDSLASEDQVALISFSDDIIINQDQIKDKQLVKDNLDKLSPSGTPGNALLNDALMEAIDRIKGRAERPMIIMVTDGKDSGLSEYTIDQVIDEAVRQGVMVNSVVWGGASQEDLAKLADRTQGEMQFLSGNRPDPVALQAAFNNISNGLPDLRVQYNIDFSSSIPADGKEHDLVVMVDHLGSHAEASRRFSASPGEVKITFPDHENGQDVGGFVHFAPDITAPAPIKQMDIILDGTRLDPVTSEPFEYVWNSTNVSYESHDLKFVIIDESDNSGEASLLLVVRPPVTVEITNPAEGETVDSPTVLSAIASAPFSQIAKVDFFVNDSYLATVEEPPYEVEWDLTNIAAGSHTIKTTATDLEDFSADSAVSVNVALRNTVGPLWIALLAVLAVAAVMIPLAFRGRRRRRSQGATGTAAGGAGVAAAVTLQSGQAYLQEESGHSPGQVWPLGDGEMRLGRKRDENDLPLKGRRASRNHAIIRNQNGSYIIFSLNPQNPVVINDQPINQQHVLQPGDVIYAGETMLRFELQD